ncbi:MAG: lipoyl synthase, partial [Abditibacteriota bacterium]|nr:lipoyl synthase [Abditibacteriota bacterium]
MVGVGETWDELMGTMRDLRSVDCDVLTVGQYLAPSANHVPIDRYYTPEEFDRIKEEGLNMGFKFVESGALVRSSYHAARQLEDN